MNPRTLIALAALLASGCSAYDNADVDEIIADGQNRARRTVTVGGAATVKIKPSGPSTYSGTEAVTLRARTPTLATAERTLLADTWTILGVAPGRATFSVFVNGVQIDSFDYSVEPFTEDQP